MAITSIGYDGTIDEVSWAKLQKTTASVYGVDTANSWRVTAVAGADRTISIATGAGWGRHVYDESNTNYTLQGAAVSSGSRWDMVVMRRDWAAVGGGPSAFRLNPGNATRALTSRLTDPGNKDDQPIALVQFSAGKTQPSAIVDLRAWASNGGVEIADRLALDYLAVPGAAVKLGGSTWRYEMQSNSVWAWNERPDQTAKVPLSLTYLYQVDKYRADGLLQEAPQAYKIGNRVHLGGVVSNKSTVEFTGGIAYSLAVIPAGHRPKNVEYFTIEVGFSLCRVWVRPDGNIYFMFPNKVGPITAPNLRWSLSGMSYEAA